MRMGTLYIVSTPIGNLEDITIRAIKILFSVDFILCEDTRRTGLLLQELKKHAQFIEGSEPSNVRKGEMLRFDEHTEHQKIPEVIEHLLQSKSVALVSDAGTPLISDPGFLLVRECLKRGIPVVSIPGASALLTALTTSGLPADKFTFLGYPPEKLSHRIKLFTHLLEINRLMEVTYILYCAPHKLLRILEDMKEVIGDIDIVISRELTKIHEEVWRGSLSEALKYFSNPQGEFVLLFNMQNYQASSLNYSK